MVGLVGQRTVKRYKIRSRQKLRELHISDKIKVRILIHIVSDHIHSKSMTYPRHGSPDLTGSDDTGCLAVEVHACKSDQTEVVLPHLYIALVQSPVHRHGKCHRMLRHSLRRIARNPHHSYTAFFCRIHIHVVEARASHQYKLHARITQRIHNGCTHIRADKCTYGVIPLCKPCGLHRQICVHIIYGQLVVLIFYRIERLHVITLCIIK